MDYLKAGESLTYEGKYLNSVLKIFRGVDVAELHFTILQAPNSRNFQIKAEAKSKGSISNLFNFDFYQRIESTIDGNDHHILKTIKRDEQNNRVRDSEAVFDYENKKVIYTETDPKDPARAPRRIASPIEAGMQDIVSAVYMLRGLPLEVGKTFEITFSDSGMVYKVPVRVTARERQKSILGKVMCWRVEPEVFGTNRPIEQEGNMIIWITDDSRRIPVRAQVNSKVGRVEIKLKKAEKINNE
ncbi:MAG TPA: DUF3108 domain-containing protein, partial [Pyrinomonadaceae bacterium]|nr:DUF3108 domain-containing protein [Pyrinomonadaceae bacterium]